MDFKGYFNPLKEEVYQNQNNWQTTQLGHQIQIHNLSVFPEYQFCELAIFNVREYEGSENLSTDKQCKIRNEIYNLHFDNAPRICDLGFFDIKESRKESFKKIEEACVELLENGILPVIIGGGHDITYALYKAYSSLDRSMTLTTVDKKFDLGLKDETISNQNFFSKILEAKPNNLFHYSNIGYQTFFVSPLAINMLNELNFDTLRLGNVTSKIRNVEPVLRNTDMLSFDLSSIKSSDLNANKYSSPNGLSSVEACKIMRYAGLSDKLSLLAICEYNQLLDLNGLNAQLVSQMIWYFLDGIKSRKNELNPNVKNCIKYTVSFDDGKNEIIFYKSNLSARWWMGVPYKNLDNSNLDHYFVACSYEDYEQANRGEIPNKWIKTFNKLS